MGWAGLYIVSYFHEIFLLLRINSIIFTLYAIAHLSIILQIIHYTYSTIFLAVLYLPWKSFEYHKGSCFHHPLWLFHYQGAIPLFLHHILHEKVHFQVSYWKMNKKSKRNRSCIENVGMVIHLIMQLPLFIKLIGFTFCTVVLFATKEGDLFKLISNEKVFQSMKV